MPTKTPVELPMRRSGDWPAFSSASHATVMSRRCWGSMVTASRGDMPKKSASNLSTSSRKLPQRVDILPGASGSGS